MIPITHGSMENKIMNIGPVFILLLVAILVIFGLIVLFWGPAKENLSYIAGTISNLIPTG